RGVVALPGKDHDVSGAQHRSENGRRRRHARCENERRAALELAERGFVGGPCRIVESAVGEWSRRGIAGGVERPGEYRTRKKGRALGRGWMPGPHDQGLV